MNLFWSNGTCWYICCRRLSNTADIPVWRLDSSASYTTKSFYAQINWGGVEVPNRYLVFVRLVIHNKILTRDNLSKRQVVEDLSCLFCSEPESVNHLLCGCIVAEHTLQSVSEVFDLSAPNCVSDLACLWDCNNKKKDFWDCCCCYFVEFMDNT